MEEKGLLASKPSGPDDAEDGWLEDVGGMYNFLCCNAALMKDRAPRIKSRKEISTLIIHDWQKETAEILFGKDIKAVIINEKRFRIFLTAVESLDRKQISAIKKPLRKNSVKAKYLRFAEKNASKKAEV